MCHFPELSTALHLEDNISDFCISWWYPFYRSLFWEKLNALGCCGKHKTSFCMNKKKQKTHGTLKNKEAFKGTLKQWGLISKAMLQGGENIGCFCDYTLTFSHVLCMREWDTIYFFSSEFVIVCVCAHAWIIRQHDRVRNGPLRKARREEHETEAYTSHE